MVRGVPMPPVLTPRAGGGQLGARGFSLIDGLVALALLGIGILVAAGMQDMALSRSRHANEMTVATSLAAEIMERIVYNRANVTAYGGIDTLNINTQPPATQPTARGDYDQWRARLAATGLDGVQGTITVTSVPPTILGQSLVTVRIGWDSLLRRAGLTMGTQIAPE